MSVRNAASGSDVPVLDSSPDEAVGLRRETHLFERAIDVAARCAEQPREAAQVLPDGEVAAAHA